MNKNVKAALLSAFILPGVGQIYLGRRVKGGVLILMVTVLLLIFIVLVLIGMQDLFQAYSVSGGADIAVFEGRLRRWAPAALTLGVALFLVWGYGIVDAFRGNGEGGGAGESLGPPRD